MSFRRPDLLRTATVMTRPTRIIGIQSVLIACERISGAFSSTAILSPARTSAHFQPPFHIGRWLSIQILRPSQPNGLSDRFCRTKKNRFVREFCGNQPCFSLLSRDKCNGCPLADQVVTNMLETFFRFVNRWSRVSHNPENSHLQTRLESPLCRLHPTHAFCLPPSALCSPGSAAVSR
jgi:hypothetical protein